SAGADKTVKLWDLAKGTAIRTFGPLADPVSALAWSRDNTLLAAAGAKTVKVFSAGDGKELATITSPADVRSLSLSPAKTKLAVGTPDKTARVYELPAGKELQFFAQDDEVSAVVFDTKNTGVISAGGKTSRHDTLSIARTVPVSAGPIHALALTGNNTHVL